MLNLELKAIADKIQDSQLRGKVVKFLEDPTFSLEGKVYSGPAFDVSPGGLTKHHAYVGGYLEHVLGTAKLAFALCDIVEGLWRQS